MILSEMRTKFKEATGILQLTDPQVDYYLDAGERWVDDRSGITRQLNSALAGSNALSMAIDAYEVTVVRPKRIDAILWYNSDGKYGTPLEYLTYVRFREVYEDIADETAGTPVHWTWNQSAAGGSPGRNHYDIPLLIGPPTDEAITIEVVGKFFPVDFNEVDDPADDGAASSVWSKEYPSLVQMAAKYHLELEYENVTGANLLLAHLHEGMMGPDHTAATMEDPGWQEMQG